MASTGSYAKGIAKREEILAVALETIATQGFRGASVREIAEAAGLSPAGLLHYFDSKEELFTEILRVRDAHETVDEHGDAFTTFMDVTRRNMSVPGLVRLYAEMSVAAADPEHPAHTFFVERTRALEAIFVASVHAAQEEGRIRADIDAAWVVRATHALADGLQPMWLIDSSIDMAGDIETFLSLLRPAPAASGAA